MGVLSAIPRVIVVAMQIGLAALLVLAVVPLAIGGLDVSDIEAEEPEYEDGVITFSASAVVDANLFFDITDFGYSISIISGDERISITEEPGITISKKGTTDIIIKAEIPLTSVMMLILLGAVTEDTETRMELTVRGSTMMGMISASAQMDILVPTVANADEPDIELAPGGDDIISMSLNLTTDALSDILDMIPDHMEVEIGGTLITFDKSAAPGGEIEIEFEWISKVLGKGLIESIEEAIAAAIAGGGDGGIDIKFFDGTNWITIHLTKEQIQFIIEVLKIILELMS